MRKRHFRARVWLDENEYEQFIKNVARSGLSQETYLRKLNTGHVIKESPPLEYYELIRQLSAIGRNLNQIATKINSIRDINVNIFNANYNKLLKAILSIQAAFEM